MYNKVQHEITISANMTRKMRKSHKTMHKNERHIITKAKNPTSKEPGSNKYIRLLLTPPKTDTLDHTPQLTLWTYFAQVACNTAAVLNWASKMTNTVI